MPNPWAMASVGNEFSEQSALFCWAAMARARGLAASFDKDAYDIPGVAQSIMMHNSLTNLGVPLEQLKWLHAIKNQGHGDKIRGGRSKAEGVRAGVFDVFLPVPMNLGGFPLYGGSFHGLYLELKNPAKKAPGVRKAEVIVRAEGKASEVQEEFQKDMRAAGYAAEIVVGWEAARDCLLSYLGV